MARTTDFLANCSIALSVLCGLGAGCSADCEHTWTLVGGAYYWGEDWSGAGTSLAVGDVDGDGLDEIVVGQQCWLPEDDGCSDFAPDHEWISGAFLLDAPFDGGKLADVAVATFGTVTSVNSHIGAALAIPGDLTGDGVTDIVAWGDREDDDGAGEIGWHVFAGPFAAGAVVSPTEAGAVVEDASGSACGGEYCSDVAPCHWDGDGVVDLCTVDGVVRGPLSGEYTEGDLCAGFEAGRLAAADLDGDGVDDVVTVLGGVSGEQATISVLRGDRGCGEVDLVEDASAVWTYEGLIERDHLLAGSDLDGDGLGDIVFSETTYDPEADRSTPRAWVLGGVGGGAVADADIAFAFPGRRERVVPLASGDFDGDGFADLAIGLSDLWVNIFRGPLSPGVYSERDADALLTACDHSTCEGPGDCTGIDEGFAATLAAGDLDGDGRDDLVIGAPQAVESGLDHSGRVYIAWGGGL